MKHLIAEYPEIIINFATVGLLAVDRQMNIILWNRFMEIHSQMKADEVLGRDLFDCFPELPKKWLTKKLKTVMVLKNASFTSWKQRPYVFKFQSTQPFTGESQFMYQDCSMWAIKDRSDIIQGVCISVHDMTETAIAQKLLEQVTEEALTLEETSQRDGLTNLFNRQFFDEQISQEIQRARRYNWPVTLMMLDIDHFKEVNDTYGHQAGDVVLQKLARLLLKLLRTTDNICRYGGEEFAIILPQVDPRRVNMITQRLLETIRSTKITIEATEILITVSIGYSHYRTGMLPGDLIGEADKALYLSKENGRNQATEFPLAE